jgi:O-methyltransferase
MKSVSLRRASGAWSLLTTIAKNVAGELLAASRGVRRTDLWREDPTFVALLDAAGKVSMLNPAKMYSLYQFARSVASLPGEAAELGVFRGGSARVLGTVFRGRTLHLFDTFSGMPFHDPARDYHLSGDFQDTSLAAVQAFLHDVDGLVFHQGTFTETLPSVADRTFAFVHIDADLYASVRECCEFFYPRMTRGGILLFDDYGFVSCPGAREAVDAFFATRPEVPVYLLTGQCLVVRSIS